MLETPSQHEQSASARDLVLSSPNSLGKRIAALRANGFVRTNAPKR
jgi:hypothetical protein